MKARAAWLALLSSIAAAQDAPVLLDTVTITAQRTRQASFDAPAAISAITRETLEAAGPQVNLSEALNRVPGISVLNRQNYAQDLQLSIRGFGARSTFGIRGVRLIVDGIPATMPDGQGQASSVVLSSAGRIEVLRGPLAQLYGNAAGGVVQVFSEDAAALPTISATAAGGADGLFKLGAKFSTRTPACGLVLDASQFRTEGWREHSAAQRGQFNGRWHAELAQGSRLSVVVNALDQPLSQDPIGLTRAQFDADPHQTAAPALAQDARKSVRQQQIGTLLEHSFDAATLFTGRVYTGARELDNALSTPLAPQSAPTSSGGIVQFSRRYSGAAAQLAHSWRLGDGRVLRLTGGIEVDRMHENRQGHINDAGMQGALKRDEDNRVDNQDLFVQAGFDLTPQWTLTAGARTSRVRFRTQDHFIAPGNPDDSGAVDYRATNPVLGIAWRATPALNLYANAGRGFETPTFTELAYRKGATGLNTELRASRSRHAEIGAKWIAHSQRIDLALFDIATRDEIVVDSNDGGRSTFRNAGHTSRRGVELSHTAQLSDTLRSTLSLSALRARFDDGKRLPGTPQRNAFAELAWTPARVGAGFNAALELVHIGALYVDDANTDAAASATLVNLRAGFAQSAGGWRFSELLRVDNATDRRYAGSVIINEANKRFFEPALPRRLLLAVTAKYELR